MCGIRGFARIDGGSIDRVVAKRMSETLVHHGSDSQRTYVNARVGIASRHLVITELVGGHQPISNEAGSIWVGRMAIHNNRECARR